MKIWNHTKRASLCAATLLLAQGATSPARASLVPQQSRTVATADLDLNTEQGQKRLERRIRRAARLVCPKAPGSVIPALDCVNEAEAAAWQTVRSKRMLAEAPRESVDPAPRNVLFGRDRGWSHY